MMKKNPIKNVNDELPFPIQAMAGVPEDEIMQVETVPGPTTAITLRVTLRDDPNRKIFVKTVKKGTKPGSHLNLGLREVRFYAMISELGPDPYPSIPKCVNYFVTEDQSGYYLVLEDLSETHQAYDVIDFSDLESWKIPLRALAHFHRAFTGKLTGEQIWDIIDGRDAVEGYLEKLDSAFLTFREDYQGLIDESVFYLMERSLPLIRQFEFEKLARITENNLTTILHRDAHLKNFLYPRSAEDEAVIVDWQFWGLGIGTFDLRHLLGSALGEDLRQHQQDLVRYYYDEYCNGLDVVYAWTDCWDDYRKGIVDNLFMPVWQYTGFGWTREQWGKTLKAAVENFHALGCDSF